MQSSCQDLLCSLLPSPPRIPKANQPHPRCCDWPGQAGYSQNSVIQHKPVCSLSGSECVFHLELLRPHLHFWSLGFDDPQPPHLNLLGVHPSFTFLEIWGSTLVFIFIDHSPLSPVYLQDLESNLRTASLHIQYRWNLKTPLPNTAHPLWKHSHLFFTMLTPQFAWLTICYREALEHSG